MKLTKALKLIEKRLIELEDHLDQHSRDVKETRKTTRTIGWLNRTSEHNQQSLKPMTFEEAFAPEVKDGCGKSIRYITRS